MKPYEIIVDEILEKLKKPLPTWKQSRRGYSPMNFETEAEYKGINKLLLLFDDFEDKRYLTAKQIQKLGGYIKKGSKATKIIYWQIKEYEEEKYPVIKYYNVFNISEVDGIQTKLPVKIKTTEIVESAESIINNFPSPPSILYGYNPSYNPKTDIVKIPSKADFTSISEYYVTLFHELIHSTGSETRLSRFKEKEVFYGKKEYSREELVAEIGSLFLALESGITENVISNCISYIKGWLKSLEQQKKELIYASIQAEKATNYILGK